MKTVNTIKFQAVHGKQPKGFGLWFFQDNLGNEHQVTASYSEAKKSALKNLVGMYIDVLG